MDRSSVNQRPIFFPISNECMQLAKSGGCSLMGVGGGSAAVALAKSAIMTQPHEFSSEATPSFGTDAATPRGEYTRTVHGTGGSEFPGNRLAHVANAVDPLRFPLPVVQQRRQSTGDTSCPSGPIALDVESVIPSLSVEKSSGIAGRERPGSPEPGCRYVHNAGEGSQSEEQWG